MRKKGILIVGLALMIAAAGVVYAHWTETLTVDATVNTGSIDVIWTELYTNDDGVVDYAEEPGAGVGAIYTFPSKTGGATSVDPSSAGFPSAASRVTKDVANCIAGGELTDTYTLNVYNGYPQYYCTMWSTFTNTGTVPVKLQSIAATTTGFTMGTEGGKITHDGTLCGLQVDPGETVLTINTLFLLNAAGENATYKLGELHTFVNWNEWSQGSCLFTFNGTPITWGIEP